MTGQPAETSAADRHAAAVAGDTLVRAEDVHTHFPIRRGLLSRGSGGAVRAVDGVSFDIARGETFGLVGESGSGKTTLGRTLLGLEPATSGSIRYDGRELVGLRERDLRPLRRELALIFQDPHAALNPAMTVWQGVGHPLRIHGLATKRADVRARVAAMLERVGLTPADTILDKYPEDLSGGQKQRLVIARALITEPKFVVADEPVAALDMSVRARVLELMLELQRDLGLTYLFITHDLATARFLCDRIGILYLGNLVEWGEADRLFDDPQHPYTRSLLSAVPLPDPARRSRDKELPVGEMPDAQTPPAGCRFHPRCPAAFEPCGWEGTDLVDYFERRWTEVDTETFEAELDATGGLHAAEVTREQVRFGSGDTERLVSLLTDLQLREAHPLFRAVVAIERDGGHVLVRFGEGAEPALQTVAGREVACHLHGLTSRER
ncbi:ABC transporter ATP-binding protein [Egibacter rhizosphaerae]|uniref:ABC transporter ATP-binding protein n=1 Tax=Egibacter rhizosphaerae TaxID=1670831 RepID=A0A411YJY4_9ACTN|nr:ABC transporter ATP-binding protein [Egibacter rhizosphaerae]QBI21514.1 ABC transporter ATP-binding protein [Egibacter rhizosphaerae]